MTHPKQASPPGPPPETENAVSHSADGGDPPPPDHEDFEQALYFGVRSMRKVIERQRID